MAIGLDDRTGAYESADAHAHRDRSLGEHVFIWIAWACAAFFWGLTTTVFFGILHAVSQPTPPVAGAVDAGGAGFVLTTIVGVVVLGAGIAFGSYTTARRNRRLDPMTEAATAAIYDGRDGRGGMDMPRRSPELHRERTDFR
jgi:hypothetical protein